STQKSRACGECEASGAHLQFWRSSRPAIRPSSPQRRHGFPACSKALRFRARCSRTTRATTSFMTGLCNCMLLARVDTPDLRTDLEQSDGGVTLFSRTRLEVRIIPELDTLTVVKRGVAQRLPVEPGTVIALFEDLDSASAEGVPAVISICRNFFSSRGKREI